MSDRNYPSGLPGTDDSQPDKRLSSLSGPVSTVQLSAVAGSRHVTQLIAGAGSLPVVQLNSVGDSYSVAQLSAVGDSYSVAQLSAGAGPHHVTQLSALGDSYPVAQLSSVDGSNPVIQLGSVGDPYPAIQLGSVDDPHPLAQLSSVPGPHPVIQLGSVDFDYEAFLGADGNFIQNLDVNTLVDMLGITLSTDERTKLQDDPATYTDLLPPVQEASHGQPVGVMDFEDMQCDQPQPATLHREQGREFLEQLVSSCQSDGSQASQTGSPSPPDATPDKTKRRRRQSSADNPAGGARQAKRRRQKPKKKYELDQPLKDPLEEKKRLNAINSKKNRDNKKLQLVELDDRVKKVTAEKNKLELEVQQLREREEELRKAITARFGIALPRL